MRIEISKAAGKKFTEGERTKILELISRCVKTHYLISEDNNDTLVIIECIPEEIVQALKKKLSSEYDVTVKEDSFMAGIDLYDMLTGGLW
jgi:hypothetical protein